VGAVSAVSLGTAVARGGTTTGGPVDHVAVVGTICGQAADGAFDLPKQIRCMGRVVTVAIGQHVGGNLAAAGVHGEVKLAPLPAGPPVFLRVPLALPEQLQAGAVQHEVHRPVVPGSTMLPSGESATAPGQGGVVGHGQIESEQAQHAPAERLGLAQARWKTSRSVSTNSIATSE